MIEHIRKPKIFHQPEKSYHCGACATASVLDYFGVEPPPILTLFKQLRGETEVFNGNGLYSKNIQYFFQRMDWVAIESNSGGPEELREDGKRKALHSDDHQKLATWRNIHQMLRSGFLCIVSYETPASTQHFAVIYDAFIRRNIYWLKIACSGQGYMEIPAVQFLHQTGTQQLFVKPHANEYR